MANSAFTYQQTKSGLVLISANNRVVTTLKGKEALKFIQKIDPLSLGEQQLLMAKVTGQFKFGNERRAKGSDQR
ncbi:MAG: hypothetical protein K9M49_01605 [Candidatus Marinimicrobia bacterium]|nr:hypothetical protein [Candidatus Neomarinimicrobiota bacterium]MCF7850279.1 hypothetical protein [Candidatus Neomarinimicrobiota bacterium]MCF7903824.1 hypothetical protein [Candidatus Neomarinimicrobiota bacterium]